MAYPGRFVNFDSKCNHTYRKKKSQFLNIFYVIVQKNKVIVFLKRSIDKNGQLNADTGAYSESRQTSKMKRFVKTADESLSSTVFAKQSISDG